MKNEKNSANLYYSFIFNNIKNRVVNFHNSDTDGLLYLLPLATTICGV